MNWEAIGASAEAIAAIGVVVTLAYLAVQIRGHTRATRVSSFQSNTDSLNQVNLMIAENRELAAMYTKSFDLDAVWDPVELTQWRFILLALFRIFESAYYQRKEGVIAAQSWARYDESLRRSMQTHKTREWWDSQKVGFTPAFMKYVNQIADETTA